MTMTNQQALEEYAKLAEIVGWPEWEGRNGKLQLRYANRRYGPDPKHVKRGWCKFFWFSAGPYFSEGDLLHDDYEALCIWENHVRRWLADTPDLEMHTKEGLSPDIVLVLDGDSPATQDQYFGNESQDANLIAAAKWVAEQKEEDDD